MEATSEEALLIPGLYRLLLSPGQCHGHAFPNRLLWHIFSDLDLVKSYGFQDQMAK